MIARTLVIGATISVLRDSAESYATQHRYGIPKRWHPTRYVGVLYTQNRQPIPAFTKNLAD